MNLDLTDLSKAFDSLKKALDVVLYFLATLPISFSLSLSLYLYLSFFLYALIFLFLFVTEVVVSLSLLLVLIDYDWAAVGLQPGTSGPETL